MIQNWKINEHCTANLLPLKFKNLPASIANFESSNKFFLARHDAFFKLKLNAQS